MTVTQAAVFGWDHAGENVDGFRVYVDGASEPAVSFDADARSVAALDLGLAEGLYSLAVAAFNAIGESTMALLDIAVVTDVPAPPENFRVLSK
jgi:hypothetical protein